MLVYVSVYMFTVCKLYIHIHIWIDLIYIYEKPEIFVLSCGLDFTTVSNKMPYFPNKIELNKQEKREMLL